MKLTILLPLLSTFMLMIASCKKENNPPIIANQSFEILENSPGGTIVGKIIASDPDGNKLTFEIISTEEIPFDIDPINKNLIVNNGYSIDFETKTQYTFIVKVTDSDKSPLFNLATITVVVKDVNEFPTVGMIAYYPLNGNANDQSINQYDGDLVGPILTSDRKETANSAFSFDGINDYIKLSAQVGNGIRSISVWFRLNMNVDASTNNANTLVTREGDPDNVSEFALGIIPAYSGWAGTPGKLRFLYSITSQNYYYIQSNSASWQKDRWYHVVVIIHPTEGMKMYIDNVRQDDTTPYYNATENSYLNTYVGSYGPASNRFFNGKIDDVIFYNRALTEAEVNELYKQ